MLTRRSGSWLGGLAQASYQADLTWFASLPTRHSLSPSFTTAVDFAAARMVALGYNVTRMPVTVGAGRSENLIGDRPGSGPGARGLVVITAHLDSINLAGGAGAQLTWCRRQRAAGPPECWNSGG